MIVFPHAVDFELIIKIVLWVDGDCSFLSDFMIFGVAKNVNTVLSIKRFPISEGVKLFIGVIAHYEVSIQTIILKLK